jgi:hypothetical protein
MPHMRRAIPINLVCLIALSACGSNAGVAATQTATPTATLVPSFTPTPTMTPPPTLTPWPTSITPTLTPIASSPHFFIGDTPFRFVGAVVPGWFWAHGEGISPEDVTEDLIVSAKASGISVLHLPVPFAIENPLGVFSEDEFGDLDFFLATAARNGVYVMPVLMDGYGLAEQPEFAYHNPGGLAGLIVDERLSEAYRERLRTFIFRRNTINGRLYRDDPTIFGWDILAEPSGYPTAPGLTLLQIKAWFEETAAYVKSLDPNHLVGVNSTGSFDSQYPGYWQTWYEVFDVPSLDFVEFEENAAPVINPEDYVVSEWTLRILSLGKPTFNLVVMPIYSPSEPTCTDYVWQARFIRSFAFRNYEAGVSGISVTSWASDLAPWLPDFDICIIKTDSTAPIPEVLLDIAGQLNIPGYPNPPLDFVRISPWWICRPTNRRSPLRFASLFGDLRRGCSRKPSGTSYATLGRHQDTCPDRRCWVCDWPGGHAVSWVVTCPPECARMSESLPEPPGGREASQEQSGWGCPSQARGPTGMLPEQRWDDVRDATRTSRPLGGSSLTERSSHEGAASS